MENKMKYFAISKVGVRNCSVGFLKMFDWMKHCKQDKVDVSILIEANKLDVVRKYVAGKYYKIV